MEILETAFAVDSLAQSVTESEPNNN